MKTEFENTSTKSYRLLLLLMAVFISFVSFNSNAKTGKEIFKGNCGACHRLTDEKMIGPGLKGINEKYDQEWILKWIKNSGELIASGDSAAVAIYEEYNEMAMPSYDQYSDEELTSLLEYIDVAGQESESVATTANVDEAESSGSGIDMTLVWWAVVFFIVVLFFLFRFTNKTKRLIREVGLHPDPHHVKNYLAIFILFFLIALGLIFLLVQLLDANEGMINTLMFTVLPYSAFTIFIAGSIYRYTKRGYQVSSLSSQFIEGKKLFWGSQPFHWGLLFLFFGHLTAFLFPRAILAWNGQPVRLLILEVSGFAFGLAALLGLILLIKRRLQTKTLLVVTNKMDMVVYTVLLTQVVSGLGVAFFVRWGSSWFSSVLTPYLRSILSFNPDINAVSEMPWWIQIHIISAFLMIAIIPFTRFMHFLVAPVDYAWRKYQLVVWNWNRKEIRNSGRHTFGKKPRNH